MKAFRIAILAAAAAGSAWAGFESGLPDKNHAWGMNDPHRPYPEKVDVERGGIPSDAVVVDSASAIGADLARDCQLRFCCRSLSSLSYFGQPLSFGAKPGEDGWIVVDAVLHAGGDGHSGYAMVFVNGLFALETRVNPAKGAKPVAAAGKELCRMWVRSSPPPWTERLCGAYADRELIEKSRRESARKLLAKLSTMSERMPGSRWGEGKAGFAMRRIDVVITAYAYCQDEEIAKVFHEECDALAEKIRTDAAYGAKGRLLPVSRILYPLLRAKLIDGDFPLWRAIAEKGVKPWG